MHVNQGLWKTGVPGLEGGRDVGPIGRDDDGWHNDALDAYHAWLAGDRPVCEPEPPDGHTLEL
jgi:hypothetical protein